MKFELGDGAVNSDDGSAVSPPSAFGGLRCDRGPLERVEVSGGTISMPDTTASLEIALARVGISTEALLDIAPDTVLEVALPPEFPVVVRFGGVLLNPAVGRIAGSTLRITILDPDRQISLTDETSARRFR